MSLKPPKKSDLGKSWMKPRRDKNILIRPEYHLIVTVRILWPFMDFAIANAERLDAMNEGKTPASSAPGTKVHVLIKHLRPYLKME